MFFIAFIHFGMMALPPDTVIGKTSYNHVEHYNGHKLKELGHTRNGKPCGYWIGFYENGNNREVSNYRKGRLSGDYYDWYSNGQMREEGQYRKGRKTGKWITRDKNGVIMQVDVYDRKGRLKKSMSRTDDKQPAPAPDATPPDDLAINATPVN